MTRLEEAVHHDLAAAPAAPPIERITRHARRRRFRRGTTGLAVLVVISTTVALAVRSADSGRVRKVAVIGPGTSVTSSAVPTSRPPDASLPVATEKIFPGLTQVMHQAQGYERADGPVIYGEIVATTRDKTYALFGGRIPVDTRPIYLVRLVGTFTCNGCSTPSNTSPAPHGTEILFIFSPAQTDPTNPLGGFSIRERSTDLSQLGRVYRLPPIGTDNGPLTRPIIAMNGCVPAWADQGSGTVKLFSLPNPLRTVQVLANPARGIVGPYAIVERFFANASPIGAPAPAVWNINGRLTSVYVGRYGQGNVVWKLADGSEAYIRTRGFDQAQLIALARALRPRPTTSPIPGFDMTSPAPFGLAVIGETAGPVHGTSQSSGCTLANGAALWVTALHGDTVFEYGVAMDWVPLPIVAQRGDTAVMVVGPPAAALTASRSIRNASIQQWAALPHHKQPAP